MKSSVNLGAYIVCLLFVVLAACPCSAQLVKAFSITSKSTCNTQVSIFVANDGFANSYIPYMDGCKATAFSLLTGQTEYSLDLASAGLQTASYVGLYRDIEADGKWSVFATFSSADGYDIYSYSNGLKSFVAKGYGSILPSIKKAGSNVYIVVYGKEDISVYITRNNMVATSVTFRNNRNVTELDRIGIGNPLKFYYDALGESITDKDFNGMTKYGRRTTFGKN